MARHSIKSFEVSINPAKTAVYVEIETELKKPYKFNLMPDANYSSLDVIEEKLTAALQHCVDTYEKADFDIFPERNYVSIMVKDHISIRFTGVSV